MASTAATTRVERPKALAALVSALLGLTLLILAGPRVVDEMALLKPAAVIAAVDAGLRADATEIAGAAAAAQVVARGPVAARANRIAGQLHMAAAARLGGTGTPAGRAEYDRAATRFAAALAAAPADRFAWWWLVTARWNSAQHLAAAQAWRAAALTGLFDPELMFARIEGGIALWPYLDAAAREAFADQLAVHWRWGPGGLAELLSRFRAEATMRQALAAHGEIADDLARRMAARR